MVPKAMDSLDLVEAVMLIEEVLGTEIPYNDAETFGSPREMADWLELHLSNQRPNKEAAALLRKLAKAHKTLDWLKAWKAHGDENKLPLSSAKSSGSRRRRHLLCG
jgi:phosphopantetheine binding protein